MKKLILILFLVIIILVSGCSKLNQVCKADAKICPDGTSVGRDPSSKNCEEFYPCPSVQEKIWVTINPIQCLQNPWEQDWLLTHDSYPKENEAQIIQEYYKKIGIEVFEVYIAQTEGIVCLACNCPRGDVLSLQILAEDLEKMKDLGFKPQELDLGEKILTDEDIKAELKNLEKINIYPDNKKINPDEYPKVLGKYEKDGLILVERYSCSDLCPDAGGVSIVFKDINSEEECLSIGGKILIDPAWNAYRGCTPNLQ